MDDMKPNAPVVRGSTVYLAGRMTGLPNYAYEIFNERAAFLRGLGYVVLNPAENFGGRQDLPYETYIKEAKRQVASAQAIALIPGFETSIGVMNHELPLARKLGLEILDATTGEIHDRRDSIYLGIDGYRPIPVPEKVVEPQAVAYESVGAEAERLVNGDRQAAYSHPYDDYLKTAKMWSGLLAHKLKEDITPEEAVMMMVCLKLSREQYKHKRDNLVDGCGYILLIEMIRKKRIELATK